MRIVKPAQGWVISIFRPNFDLPIFKPCLLSYSMKTLSSPSCARGTAIHLSPDFGYSDLKTLFVFTFLMRVLSMEACRPTNPTQWVFGADFYLLSELAPTNFKPL